MLAPVIVQPDQPIECVLCGLDPIAAMAHKVKPALLTHPGFILCECYGPEPYSVAEVLGNQEPDAFGKVVDERTKQIRQAFLDSQHRGERGRGDSSNGPSRKAKVRPDFRQEQQWAGFADEDRGATMKVEGLTAPIKAKVPRLLLQRLKSEAKREGTTTSRLFRWYLSRHLVALEEGFAVTRGDTAALVVKVTPQHLVLFEAKRASLGCSVPELVAGVLIRQFA